MCPRERTAHSQGSQEDPGRSSLLTRLLSPSSPPPLLPPHPNLFATQSVSKPYYLPSPPTPDLDHFLLLPQRVKHSSLGLCLCILSPGTFPSPLYLPFPPCCPSLARIPDRRYSLPPNPSTGYPHPPNTVFTAPPPQLHWNSLAGSKVTTQWRSPLRGSVSC